MSDTGDKGLFGFDEATLFMSRNKETGNITWKYLAGEGCLRPNRVMEIVYRDGQIKGTEREPRRPPVIRAKLLDMMYDLEGEDPVMLTDSILDFLEDK